MAGAVSGGYFPIYPWHDNLPDPEIRTFITNFYRVSDKPDSNELWVSYFVKDARVTIGNDKAHGEKEIRALRERMWTVVQERKHTVTKVFPGRFKDPESQSQSESGEADKERERECECECMLFGTVEYRTKDGQVAMVPWAGHAVLRKVKNEEEVEEWRFAQYRVYLQR